MTRLSRPGFGTLLVSKDPSNHTTSAAVNLAGTTTSCSMTMSKTVQCPVRPLAINMPCSTADPSEGVVSWLPFCTDVAMHPIESYTTEKTNVLFKYPQGAQGPFTSMTFSEEVNNAREICVTPSLVNGQLLSVHSLYSDLDNLTASNSIVPGITSSWPLSELGPPGLSTTSNVVTNMPYDLPGDEIIALLSRFSEDRSMIKVEKNERPDMQNSEIYRSDTFMGNNIPFEISHRQCVGSSIASQIQRRVLEINTI